MLWLMSGRTLGSAASFAIPLVLVRFLDQAEYGTYRQIFLFYGTLFVIAQVGSAESLYYFLPRDPRQAGRYVANALAMLMVTGLAVCAGMALAGPLLADTFNNPALAALAPGLGLLVGLMLVSASLEILIVSRGHNRAAGIVYALSDVGRAVLLVAPVVVAGTVGAVLVGAIAAAALRCVALGIYAARRFGRTLRPDLRLWRTQLVYALPFAAAVVLEISQMQLHQYAVAAWFEPAAFAIYAVGCLQIPLVDILSTSAANVMMVRMGERAGEPGRVLREWRDTTARLAVVMLPLAALLGVVAYDLIVLLFTDAYAASVPVFMVSLGLIVLAAFPVDGVLRARGDTRFIFLMNLGRLVFVAGALTWFVEVLGLPGAILVTVLAMAGGKVVAVVRIAHLVGTPLRGVLPWDTLARTGAAAGAAALAAVGARILVAGPPPVRLVLAGVVFAAVYAAVAWCFRLGRVVWSGPRARDAQASAA